MKKLLILVLICSMLMLATSCQLYDYIAQLPSGDNGPTVNPDGTITYVDMTAADYDEINKLMDKIGENVTVKVVSNNRGAVLSAEYVITADSVSYTVEQLNMLPEDADINKLPESMTTTYSGEAHRNEAGELIDDSGEAVVLPEGEVMAGSINFSEDNIREGKRSPYGFEGEVVSVSKLLGVKMDVESMHVKVDYSEDAIVRIVLTYVKDKATVTVTYEFSN